MEQKEVVKQEIEEEEKIKEELQHANISLILDTYDDIFSDFDPRPFSERALSDDFLLECKKAAHDKGEGIELILSMPRDKRSINDEFKIRKRLRDHFKKHAMEKEKERLDIRKNGVIWVVLGILINLAVIFGYLKLPEGLLSSFIAIFEVPSWFLIWEGMGKIFMESKKIEPDQEFYKKMSSSSIIFRSY
jgi:hypothetical protein